MCTCSLFFFFKEEGGIRDYRVTGVQTCALPIWVFDGAFLVSVLAVAAGGLPLWLLMMRSARRERRPRDIAYLLAPAVAPAAYLAVLRVTVTLIAPAHGVGPGGFPAFA